MSNFAERIRKIEAQIVDLTWMGGLFEYPEFREIHEHPTSYLSEVSAALRSPEFTDQQKKIIALSMQKLDLPRFLQFANDMLRLLGSGLVSQDVFGLVVFPPYDWNTKLAENYEQPDVARFLRSVLESKQVDTNEKKYIREEILTGKAKSYVLMTREVGLLGWPARLKSEGIHHWLANGLTRLWRFLTGRW